MREKRTSAKGAVRGSVDVLWPLGELGKEQGGGGRGVCRWTKMRSAGVEV